MNQERLLQVLQSPHISEKSSILADKVATHVFKVAADATKLEVKKAVEKLFNVKVASVNLLKVKGKTKRFRNEMGTRKSWKKAYVRLMEGHDISFENAE